MNATEQLQAKIAKASAELAMLVALTPFIVGEPRHVIPNTTYGSVAMLCYKIKTPGELADLIRAYPPCESLAGKQRGCATVAPADTFTESDAESAARADGVYFDVEANATTGAYPCYEHALSAKWYSDTPAGRVNVRVSFHYNARADWPYLHVTYRNIGFGRLPVCESWRVVAAPATANVIRYGSGSREHPGSASLWFRADSGERAAWVASLSTEEGAP